MKLDGGDGRTVEASKSAGVVKLAVTSGGGNGSARAMVLLDRAETVALAAALAQLARELK